MRCKDGFSDDKAFVVMDAAGIPMGVVKADVARKLAGRSRVSELRAISVKVLDDAILRARRVDRRRRRRESVVHKAHLA